MRTLLLDTSGPRTTVVVSEDGASRASASFESNPLCELHPTIRTVLADADLELSALDRLAVVAGPGSWTGLNIGMTAAKTLCQVLGRPLVPLPSLDALAAAERWKEGPIVAILDAKRGRVYRGSYETDAAGQAELRGTALEVVSLETLRHQLDARDGAGETPLLVEYGTVHGPTLQEAIHPRPRGSVLQREALAVPGLLATLEAHGERAIDPVADRDAFLDLTPLYLQKALGDATQ